MSISNKDIFEDFTRRIREGATDEDMMREYGGMPIYVPSWCMNGRNDEIIKDYTENKLSPKELKLKYALSLSRIYEIIGEAREPSLF